MARTEISFATFNLYNLNEPSLPMYRNSNGWSQEQYDKKISWASQALNAMASDVWAFQELWHQRSLERIFTEAKLTNEFTLLIPSDHKGGEIVCAAAVRKGWLVGEPEWIVDFPDIFKLSSQGDDPQTPSIDVNIDKFSRPV